MSHSSSVVLADATLRSSGNSTVFQRARRVIVNNQVLTIPITDEQLVRLERVRRFETRATFAGASTRFVLRASAARGDQLRQ